MHGNPDKSTLIRWNISSIPSNAVVQSASITVNISNETNQAYEIYSVLRPWVETQVSWSVAATGNSWGSPGAQGAADRGTTVLGTITGDVGFVTINLNAAGIAQVQQWVSNSATNNGIIIQDYAATNGLDFASSEATTVANRPRLTVTYAPPAMLAAGVAGPEASGAVLKTSDLAPVQSAAASRILSVAPAGDRAAIAAVLSKVQLSIASLPSGVLGLAGGNTIFLDDDASGFGWFIDATPDDDLEFIRTSDSSELVSDARSMDLLTVVMHEMEHVLGEGHADDGLMENALSAGTRHLPEGALSDAPLVDAIFSELALTSALV
jgi:hypothetical protein